jgi:ABC-type transporter Mla subunit MlaD
MSGGAGPSSGAESVSKSDARALPQPGRIRKSILVLMVVLGVVTVAIVLMDIPGHARRHVKSCIENSQGLRAGAPVRIAGVEVGIVRGVRLNLQRKDCIVEIDMGLTVSDKVEIPNDSLVELATAGVLGETYVDIDAFHAIGPPVEDYGYLKSRTANPPPFLESIIRGLEVTLGMAAAAKGSPEEGSEAVTPAITQHRKAQAKSHTAPSPAQ